MDPILSPVSPPFSLIHQSVCLYLLVFLTLTTLTIRIESWHRNKYDVGRIQLYYHYTTNRMNLETSNHTTTNKNGYSTGWNVTHYPDGSNTLLPDGSTTLLWVCHCELLTLPLVTSHLYLYPAFLLDSRSWHSSLWWVISYFWVLLPTYLPTLALVSVFPSEPTRWNWTRNYSTDPHLEILYWPC